MSKGIVWFLYKRQGSGGGAEEKVNHPFGYWKPEGAGIADGLRPERLTVSITDWRGSW